ncbi:hypothetical protein Tco_1503079 [Tanacetum coccineum]
MFNIFSYYSQELSFFSLLSDSRIANNGISNSFQKLRCRVNCRALKYSAPIEELGKTLVARMRQNGSPYLALHLSFPAEEHQCSGLRLTLLIITREEEHLAPADPAAVAYSADQDPYLAYRVKARMSIRPRAPAPFLSEEVTERLLALPTPPPSPLSLYSSPLPQIPSPPLPIPSPPPNDPTYVEGSLGSRAAGIRQRDALPSPVHENGMPEICIPLHKRSRRTTPGPGLQSGRFGSWRMRSYILSWMMHGMTELYLEPESMDACDQTRSEGISLRTTIMAQQSEITELQAADRRRQTVISELLKADYRRQRQLVEALKIVKSLKTQMIELQTQQGPAKDPAEPELPEEASSSS